MELTAAEVAMVRDLLEHFLVDGTHPVDEQAAWALRDRLVS